MNSERILISGAGIAGATAGYWLARSGRDVTVVERAEMARSSGNPVDLRGDALDIVRGMGVLDELRASATTARRAVVVAADGSRLAQMTAQNASRRDGAMTEIEVPRADLAGVLLKAANSGIDLRFGESITSIEQRDDRVDITFSSGHEEAFDLVIGADGVHSNTRVLTFGATHARRTHLGLYVGTTKAPGLDVRADEVQLYNEPGRMVSVHPGRDSPIIAYMFRQSVATCFDPGSLETQRSMVIDAFQDAGWRTPELLQHTRAAADLYLDAVARVTVPTWHKGRVVLVGDAASCVSLLGDGSSKAIIGAHALAAELSSTSLYEAAFRRYQRLHQRRVSSSMAVRAGARVLVPATGLGIATRNRVLRAANLLMAA